MLHSPTPLNITALLKASFENIHWVTCPLHRSDFCCNHGVRLEERWGTGNRLLLTHWDLGTQGKHKITWGRGFHTHATRGLPAVTCPPASCYIQAVSVPHPPAFQVKIKEAHRTQHTVMGGKCPQMALADHRRDMQ